jgi:adenylate kinase
VADAIRLVILGRQGAGKGTQASRLGEHFGVPHISTGDMLRAAVATGTEFGRKAQAVMDHGQLVSDEIMVGVVGERLAETDAVEQGYILDGFPRTMAQGEALEKITDDRPLHVVINLDVPEEVVLERITKRRVCSARGHIYSVDNPPKDGSTCDIDGSPVVQRADDTEEAVRKRLDLYQAETMPLVPFYEERGLLADIDGLGSAEEVFQRLLAAIAAAG